MSATKSESLVLVWRIAGLEACRLNAEKIEPYHVLLGLAKCVDLDLTKLVSKETEERDNLLEQLLREVRRVRAVFKKADVDPKILRRRLREEIPGFRATPLTSETIHRSAATMRIFKDAQGFADLSDQVTYPIHLLLAVLLALEKPSAALMRELGIDLVAFRHAARIEVFGSKSREIKTGRN